MVNDQKIRQMGLGGGRGAQGQQAAFLRLQEQGEERYGFGTC